MRIGFIAVKSVLRGGGVETYTYEVGRRMVALGHEVTVFSMGHYGDVPEHVQGMRVVKVPCLPGAATERITASMSGVVSALMQKPRLDILHFHTPMTGVFGIIPALLGFSTVVQMHGIDWQRSRWGRVARSTIRGMERSVMRLMPTCTAVSDTQIGFYEKRYGRRLSMIPTGAQTPQISMRSDEIQKLGLVAGNYILFMSRLVPEKGAHLLISAFRNLKTTFKLVLGGEVVSSDPYTRSLMALADGDNRILFPGFVAGELKLQLLSNAALYVQPSELEGLSIALLEAMSYCIPCLASDIPENIEAIGKDGVTFVNGDADDLLSRMNDMLTHREECERLAARGRDRVLQEFSWDKVTGMLLKLYRYCLVERNTTDPNRTFSSRLTEMVLGPQDRHFPLIDR
jgi:glycosyltransferase involved in cell wall biosynthesis